MTMLLRKQNAQDRIEGRDPFGWNDDDYAVVDEETRDRSHLQGGAAGGLEVALRGWCLAQQRARRHHRCGEIRNR